MDCGGKRSATPLWGGLTKSGSVTIAESAVAAPLCRRSPRRRLVDAAAVPNHFMTLVFHQFKKDVRQFRVFLGIWFGLLLIDLAVNLGWIGQAIYSSERGFDGASNTWTGILPVVLWAFVGVLPSLVVLADSPARRDGFLATRPLPKRDLLLAKIFFTLALIVAPWVLSELLHLTGRGMPSWVWMRGTLERLMFTLPVALGCGAFAALWPNVARWVRAIAGLFASYALIALVTSLVTYFFHLKLFNYASRQAPPVVLAYAAMLAAIAFAVWHSRAQRGVWARWGGLLATVFVSQWLASWWPWDSFQPLPENAAAASSLLAKSGFEIPSRAVTLQREQDAEKDDAPQFNIGIAPKIKNLPTDCLVDWSGINAKLARASGDEWRGYGYGRMRHAPVYDPYRRGFFYSDDDLSSWASQFPEDVLFRQDNRNNFDRERLYLSKFDLPTSHAEMTEPLTLSAELEARVFQWRVIAELPLTPGAKTNTAFGSLKFISGQSVERRPFAEVGFLRQQIELSTIAELRCSTAFGGPKSRLAYMVYDPQTHTTWLPDSYSVVTYPRAPHTALPEYYTYLSFSGRKPFTAAERARCQLIVLEKSWLGSVPENIHAPAFTLDDKLPANGGGVANNHEPMSRSEFIRRVAALKVPAPDAPRSEVSLYLLEFFRLVDAQGRRGQIGDLYVATIAKFVPHQLDLFLSGLPAMGGVSRQLVLNALKQGATESQKPALIAALSKQPELAEVLLARDWVAEARPEIYQLLKSDRPLPLSAMRAVAWFHDPETYPRLIAEFEAYPSEDTDELLHNLGLDTQLEPIIARNWRAIKLATSPNSMFQISFRLALRHGDPSTLERLYRLVVEDKEPARRMGEFSGANSLGWLIQMLSIKSGNRQNNETVLAWLQKHRPEDFVFNPARRQFVLKENSSTNATAGVNKP